LKKVINNLPLLYLILAIILSIELLIVATRSGMLRTNLARLLGMREQNPIQVNRTLNVLESLARMRASLHLTQSILRFLLAGLSILIFVPKITSLSITIAGLIILLVASLVLFWLEWLIDRIIARNPETWALRLTPIVRILMFILTPFVILPLLLSRQSEETLEGSGLVTEDDLMTLVDAGQQEGVFEKGERKMIYSIFKLGDTLAREIMVPRIDILALEVDTPLIAAVDALLQSGFSRVPVFRESVDNILGLLYAKDLLQVWREGNQLDSLKDLLRPAYFVPEAKKVDELLAEIQAQRIHMAIVVDEYGGVAGLVTLEDIVEEIVGEILDEYDQAEEMLYQVINESEYIFQGLIDLDDFNEIMNSQLPKEEADTLGGFIYSRIGRVPSGGESVQVDDIKLTVEQVTGRRIRKVKAQRLTPTPQNGDYPNHAE
jgi:putative hemolysin